MKCPSHGTVSSQLDGLLTHISHDVVLTFPYRFTSVHFTLRTDFTSFLHPSTNRALFFFSILGLRSWGHDKPASPPSLYHRRSCTRLLARDFVPRYNHRPPSFLIRGRSGTPSICSLRGTKTKISPWLQVLKLEVLSLALQLHWL